MSIEQKTLIPSWVADYRILATEVFNLLSKTELIGSFGEETLRSLFSDEALRGYWVKCFTHKNIDANNNNDLFEFFGDKALSNAFSKYLRKRFPKDLNQANATLLHNKYMSKKYQAGLAERLGLVNLLYYDPDGEKNTSVKEDTFEAFAGCIQIIFDDLIAPGLGDVQLFNLIVFLFKDVDIVLSEVTKDPKTILKEIYEKLQWGDPIYVKTPVDSHGSFTVEIRDIVGTVIGQGIGPEKEAAVTAAQQALKYLESKGITWETADKRKMERIRASNEAFARQYERAEKAFEIIKDLILKKQKESGTNLSISPTGFIIDKVSEEGGNRYTLAIRIVYSDGSKSDSILQYTGIGINETRTGLLREFANLYGIPA